MGLDEISVIEKRPGRATTPAALVLIFHLLWLCWWWTTKAPRQSAAGARSLSAGDMSSHQ